MVTVMMIGILEYMSGQRHWFDGSNMMVSDHEGLWFMKPLPSLNNKVTAVQYYYHGNY